MNWLVSSVSCRTSWGGGQVWLSFAEFYAALLLSLGSKNFEGFVVSSMVSPAVGARSQNLDWFRAILRFMFLPKFGGWLAVLLGMIVLLIFVAMHYLIPKVRLFYRDFDAKYVFFPEYL